MALDSHEGRDEWKDQRLDVEYVVGTLTQIENWAFHSCRRAGGCMAAVPALSHHEARLYQISPVHLQAEPPSHLVLVLYNSFRLMWCSSDHCKRLFAFEKLRT